MNVQLKSRSLGLLQKLVIMIGLAGVVIPVFAAPDNQGKEFLLGFMQNYRDDGNPSSISFYLSAPTETTVTVRGRGYGPQSVTVSPGQILPFELPLTFRAEGSGTIEDKGLLLTAPEEFIVYGLNRKQFTTDAYLGLPTDVAGTEYIVPSFFNAKSSLPSELQIIALEDGTEVTFTPKKRTIGGADIKSIKAGKLARFTMNRLQSIQFKAKGGINADLTGSVITSSKPVSVFGGHQCGIVPRRALACDHLVEQIPPTSTWGTSFLTTPLAMRTGGDIFRILAANDGTEVKVDGKRVARLKRGKFKQLNLASNSFHQITTSEPALLIQYSKGTSVDGAVSDPFMMIIPPTEQFGADYIVSTPPEEPVAFNNFINIVAPTDKLAGLRLDGNPVPAADFILPFTAIGSTGYSGAQVKVGIGAHEIKHDTENNVPFGIYSYGFANSDSYGYPGGSRLARIAEPCEPSETVAGDGLDNDCDRRIDEELLNEQDDDGDGRIDEDLAKIDVVADARGPYTVVEGGSITLNGTAQAGPNEQLIFEWDLNNDGTFETSGANPTFTGIDGPTVQTVTLKVTGLSGSSVVSTTVTVDNVAPDITGSTYCDGEIEEPLIVNFTDPAASNDTYSVLVSWVEYEGDDQFVQTVSNYTSGDVIELPAGVFGIYFPDTVTVTDNDGGSSGPATVTLCPNIPG